MRIELRTLLIGLAGILCLVLLQPGGVSAQVINFEDNWGAAGFNLVDQNPAGVEVVFSVPSMALMDVDVNGEVMQSVTIPGVLLPNNEGAPNLPGTGRYIALPQGSQAQLEVVDFRTEVFHNINLAPAFDIPRGDYDGPLVYRKDPAIYNTDAYYPEKPVQMSAQTDIRGVDVVIVGVTPFQYNPMTKDMIVYKDVRVRVNFLGGTGYFGEDRLRSYWWEPVLRQNLLNYASLPPIKPKPILNTDEDNVEYLIIVPNDPYFLAWADTLKRWRNEQGIITGITTLTEIGGNDAALIENYINNAYNNWDIPPVAVLLLSDYQSTGAEVYGITSPVWDGYCVSDNIYADINGNDLPDLNVARITAQGYQQLSTMINKMLSYERNPYTNPGFYNDPLIAGGWQSDRWFILCCEVLWGYWTTVQGKSPERQYAGLSGPPANWSSNMNTYMIVDYFGPDGLGYIGTTPSYLTGCWTGSAATINNAINNGTFMVQHRDHGSVTGWGTPAYNIGDLGGLTNEEYTYVFSANCLTGKYNNPTECFAEAFHRMEHGALGVLAASETSYSFVNDTYCWGVYDAMWSDFDPGYGATAPDLWNQRPGFGNAAGKYYLAVSSWPYNQGDKTVTYHLFHHHGDAFMTLYSQVPQPLTVLHADAILGGATQFSVTANAGSWIGLSVSGQVIGTAEGTGGPVTITINPLTPGQVMRVTVTMPNYFRYMSDVQVIPPSGPYVIAQGCSVVDGGLGWNPNGQLDYDETANLSLTMQNIGIEDAPNVVVTLSTSDSLLTILDGSENYGTVNAGASVTIPEGFQVRASSATPDDHIFIVNVLAVSGSLQWESSFALTGHAPVMAVDHLEFYDPTGNQNNWLDPGETAQMEVFLTNEGSAPGVLLSGSLSSLDPYLIVNTSTGSFGTINPEATGSATYSVSASSSCPQEYLAGAAVGLTGSHGFSGGVGFQIMIGNVLYDPTGPDSYGYMAYDPFDVPETPDYNWVEISADSGGLGTQVAFTADDQAFQFDLPFTVQYYGQDFTRYTIAANGWIGMGETTTDDYSNSAIPNADGPPNMIAGYWEDLSPQRTNSGKVWRWFDAANHRLIVEYNHVEQFSPLGSFETFQIILLDPAYYQTSTGDGRILVQYKDMSATATGSEGTIGIENGTQTIGLQYFLDGAYDQHAHPLENQMAVMYTTPAAGANVEVTLTPAGLPIQIPATGGSFNFNIAVANNGSSPVTCDIWCMVTLPDTSLYGPVLGPVNLTLPAGYSTNRNRTQNVPSFAPAGDYLYNAYMGTYGGAVLSSDSFPFTKLSTGEGPPVDNWGNSGEPFESPAAGLTTVIPEVYSLDQNYPNPFNPLTSISFGLPEAGLVKLEIYDLLGRKVATLVNGHRAAGLHEVTFDAAALASGIYVYRITANDFTAIKKMILMK